MAQDPKHSLSKFDTFDELFAGAEKHLDYWVEGAILEFTDEVLRALRASGLSRSELADKLGDSRPQISRMLSGRNNFTMRTMVEVSRALDCKLRMHLQRDGMQSAWVDYVAARRQVKLVTPVLSATTLDDKFKPCPHLAAKVTNATLPAKETITNEELSAAA